MSGIAGVYNTADLQPPAKVIYVRKREKLYTV